MHSCVYQGKKAGLGSKEMAKLNAEVKRLTKLSALKQKAAEDVLKAEIEEDRVADKRMQGAALGYEVEKQATAATAAPGASIGYMSEKDYTFWANARLKKVLEGAQLSLDSGGRIKVHECVVASMLLLLLLLLRPRAALYARPAFTTTTAAAAITATILLLLPLTN